MAGKTVQLSGLVRRLVEDGLLDEEQAREVAEDAAGSGLPLVSCLVQKQLVSAGQLARTASDEFSLPLLDLAEFTPESVRLDLVDARTIHANHAIPLMERDSRLYVALSDPTNLSALENIRFLTGLATEPVLVEEDKLRRFISNLVETGVSPDLTEEDEDLEVEVAETEVAGDDQLVTSSIDDAPVVRFVNRMLMNAVRSGVSDLHFEPFESSYRVRFRTDGILHEIARVPVNLGPRIAARIKIMSRLDISERRIPQDGRTRLKISSSEAFDVRVNTLPVLFGEKLCLRILDPGTARMGIDELGYEAAQKLLYLEALQKPQGMLLVTGPTGSGKTVSMYAGLNLLNTLELNICAVEDPVEINVPGINQCSVNHKVGLDFSKALRSFLRQDPDVIMVGEIRDLETAGIAIKAAQTGHMVMSTLHTTSASETLTRLHNMGVPAYNLATSINVIIAQRLARRLHTACRVPLEVSRNALLEKGFTEEDLAEDWALYGPGGCDECHQGYRGRTGIYEAVRITGEISRCIMEGGNSLQLAELCRREGFSSIHQSALSKVKQGITSMAEVDRVTSR